MALDLQSGLPNLPQIIDDKNMRAWAEDLTRTLHQMFTALYTDLLNVKNTGFVETGNLADDSVTTIKIVNEAITTTKIVNEAITTAKIDDDAVTTQKIVDASVTILKMAADSVGTTQIVDTAITEGKIADLAVSLDKLAADSVDSSKIIASSVGTNELSANAVTAEKIAALAIETGHLSANAVTAAKMSVEYLSAISALLGVVVSGYISGAAITGGLIQTADTGRRIKMDSSGMKFMSATAASGKIGTTANGGDNIVIGTTANGGDNEVVGSGYLARLYNIDNGVLFDVQSEQTVADMHLFNRSNTPSGAARVGDICVVQGKLEVCTVAGTPGTWVVVGTQT